MVAAEGLRPDTPEAVLLLAPAGSNLPSWDRLSGILEDPLWGSAFAHVGREAGAQIALYIAYLYMGWPDIESYELVYGERVDKVPVWYRKEIGPWLAYVHARLIPNRLFIYTRIRQMIDDPKNSDVVRGGLLRMLNQNMTEADAVPEPTQRNPVFYPANLGLQEQINRSILDRGGLIFIPGKREQGHGLAGEEALPVVVENAVEADAL